MTDSSVFWSIGGAFGGAVISVLVALFLRSFEEWREFQREIAIIRERFSELREPGIEPVQREYDRALADVRMAVARVRPYLFKAHAKELNELWFVFRGAGSNPDYGLVSGNFSHSSPMDSFPDPTKAKDKLIILLDRMERSTVSFL